MSLVLVLLVADQATLANLRGGGEAAVETPVPVMEIGATALLS